MSRASIRTRLPLDTWAAILGINPLHFSQVTSAAMPENLCSNVWVQFAWQNNNQVGREDIASAILQAEQLIEEHTHFPLLPIWVADERVRTTQPGMNDLLNVGFQDARGFTPHVRLNKGHFISGGIEAKDVIEAGAAVVYSDEDADGYPETATVTVATTVTDPQEIAVYYPGESARDEWEIRPLHDPLTKRRSVVIAGGVATIKMAREQLVDPDLLAAFDATNVNGDNAANFLTTVDVYRHYNDPQTQVTLMWSPRPELCDCGTTGCQLCAHEVQTGCLLARDYRNGIVNFSPAQWNATTEQFDKLTPAVGRIPDNLRTFYYAGFQDPNAGAFPLVEMEPAWARAVAFLSLKYLSRPICGCDNVRELHKRMNNDLALNFGDTQSNVSYQITDRDLANPFGTERGALIAWNLVKSGDRAVGQAVRY